MSPHCMYTLHRSIQSFPLLSLTPSPFIPRFSTAFNIYPYFLYLHKCYVLWYFWCSIVLLLLPSFPKFQSSSTIINMLYIWVCVWSCLFLCICLFFGSIFQIWEKTCGLCLSESGLPYLTWCLPNSFLFKAWETLSEKSCIKLSSF
jgi:hypothetical protein